MGFFDEVSSTFSRGMSAAGRSATVAKLNAQLNSLLKQRQGLAAQLGASLYEVTKSDPHLVAGRESLYEGIAQIDAQRAQIQQQLDQIKAEQEAAAAAAHTLRCPSCGAYVSATDRFCSGCGMPVEQIVTMQQRVPEPPVYASSTPCPVCGAPVQEGDSFCMNCGSRLSAPPQQPVPPQYVSQPPVPAPTEPQPVMDQPAPMYYVPAPEPIPVQTEPVPEEVEQPQFEATLPEAYEQPIDPDATGSIELSHVDETPETSEEPHHPDATFHEPDTEADASQFVPSPIEAMGEASSSYEPDPEPVFAFQDVQDEAADVVPEPIDTDGLFTPVSIPVEEIGGPSFYGEAMSEEQPAEAVEEPPAPSLRPYICPTCGNPHEPTDRFCMRCGTRLI